VTGAILELSSEKVNQQLSPRFSKREIEAVVHLVTEADVGATVERPLAALDVIVEGTRRALEFAMAVKARRFLFTSSGAVYGRQPSEMDLMGETYLGGPEYLNPSAPYGLAGEAKRYAEVLCAAYARSNNLETVIARCFSFIGPYLPLDTKFAVGNFLKDALEGREILIKGDGTPLRSYLYAADLAVWLWTLLFRGRSGEVYNVGSENPVSIRELAEKVKATLASPSGVRVRGIPLEGRAPERYIPDTRRARNELGLGEKIALAEAIKRTAAWARSRGKR